MHAPRRWFMCAVVLIGLSWCANGFADALPPTITKILNKYKIPAAAISLEVRKMGRAREHKPLLSVNAQTARNPASVIKALTTLAALELLGPGYHWETSYLADGAIENGVLRGDLILKGGGDPFISVEQLLGHVLALRQIGIQTISGDLVIDDSYFAPTHHDRNAFDGKPERLYNVGANAALVNFSSTRFIIEPHGDKVHVIAEPPLLGVKIINQLVAKKGKCVNRESGWSYHIKRAGREVEVYFKGAYRRKCGMHSVARSILSNNEYAYRAFAAVWRQLGGKLNGGYRVARTPERAQLLLTRMSEPLADTITDINKFSNNVMARHLLLTIGAEQSDSPGDMKTGIAAIRNWLAANHIAAPKLVIENGAGLSRKSRMSARGLSALLEHGWRSTYHPEFLSSLPLAAIDGTMRKRLHDSPLHGRARIKTGLINDIRSMAGYVHARDGHHYSVVMIIDSHKVNFWNGNVVQDAVLQWLYAR